MRIVAYYNVLVARGLEYTGLHKLLLGLFGQRLISIVKNCCSARIIVAAFRFFRNNVNILV